ncbi:DUF6587 family protein [Dokdonella sp.]|uniref:DUF6587 family protein n=1 Tax=Dokdonella sp. TaxID=2291710 RepID=UPI002F42B5D5
MSASLLQAIVLALAVVWSAWSALHRLLPVTMRRLQARMLAPLDRAGKPAWLRLLAARLQPKATTGASCGDGCSSCGGCSAAQSRPADAPMPLAFRPRSKPH